ncbi:MAG: LCP family protein [Propionicimonas sp.]|uniref:LCP family protein n=1 Tax=Propionicimonas sp. TaxID=1955623 RepID=UPI002B1FCCC9|nr:LCP family protein [Propionicimonas sp.]MEA4944419.1 LCP family protein [Propionicimonas sp.]
MGSTMGWTVLGTILPGVGLIRAGRRVIGSLILILTLAVIGGLGYLAVTNRRLLTTVALNPTVLRAAAVTLLVLAVAWVILIGASHLALRPKGASFGQRFAGALLVGVLSFAVAAPLSFGANLAYTSAGAVSSIFGNEQSATRPTIANTVDPWAEKDRLNVLILGGDVDAKRGMKEGVRTDTVIVASIDTATGATTLISLPRQTMAIPFPKDSPLHKKYPNGFGYGQDLRNGEFYLNAMYRNIPAQVSKDILGPTDNLGADVMKLGVGEALNLPIDYYVLINMDGFRDLINALGGITVNVNYRVPIGGKTGPPKVAPTGWIEPGPNQHLTGRLALWYARGRYGMTDYERQDRQRCVINAVVQQASPQNLLLNYEKIANAGEKTILTDVPDDMLSALLDLATRVQGTKLRSLSFRTGTDGFVASNPDWDKVRARVKTALKETTKANTKDTEPSSSATPSPGSTPSSSATPTTSAPTRSSDLDDACAYHPQKKK